MSSLSTFLRDYIQYNYSITEIVDRYVEWVKDVKYMILSRWNRKEGEMTSMRLNVPNEETMFIASEFIVDLKVYVRKLMT